MKINVISLIEDALVGGRNGEMVYVYNNPFVFEFSVEAILEDKQQEEN